MNVKARPTLYTQFCERCGRVVESQKVGFNMRDQKPVYRYCATTDGVHAPIDCIAGGYHAVGGRVYPR